MGPPHDILCPILAAEESKDVFRNSATASSSTLEDIEVLIRRQGAMRSSPLSGGLCFVFLYLAGALTSAFCHPVYHGRARPSILPTRLSPTPLSSTPSVRGRGSALQSALRSHNPLRHQPSAVPYLMRLRGGAKEPVVVVAATASEMPDPIALQATLPEVLAYGPPPLPLSTLLTEVLIASWAPCMLAAINIWAYRSRFSLFPVDQEEMLGKKVLQGGEWHRVWTSLFVHDRPRDLSLSCLGIVSAGTVCSLLFGQAQATLIYLLSGLTGNLLKLGVDLLGRRLTGKLFLSSARDRFGVYVGDMGLGPSQSSCGSVGATLGLVAALWQVVVKELALRDVRALGPWARGVVQLNYFLAVLLGAATATLTILEALFPRFGKVNLLGGVFAGMLCGILLPYKTLRPLAVKPM